MFFTTAAKRYCDVECNLIILFLAMISKISFHFTSNFLYYAIPWKLGSFKICIIMHYSLLGSVTWNYKEVMTGLIVSLGGTWLEAEVTREWTDTLLVEQSCTGTCFQHLLRNKLPSHSVVIRLNGFNSDGAEINEISHLGEFAWVRKPQEDWVKREGDGHMRKNQWKTTSGPGPEEH